MRMLMNNLDEEVAERPQDLVVYGGTGRAARNWECYHAIVNSLRFARERRDAAGAVGQAGRGFSYARLCAARAHLQLQPGWPLVELGEVQRTREAGPHHVRPDDRRLVDLHRVAGHHPGHVRDVLRCRRKASGRRPRRQADRLRRHGRHERSPASGRDHDGRMLPRHRGRSRTHQETLAHRAIATSWSTRSTKRCAS